eukprot:g5220.t1
MYGRMHYWHDVGRGAEPAAPSSSARYLSFEPDFGGFNNVRLEVEIVVLLAALMGRTLVLPPDQHIYLLDGMHSLLGFFDEASLRAALAPSGGIVTREEFVAREAKRLALDAATLLLFKQECPRYSPVCRSAAMRKVALCPQWNALERVLGWPDKARAWAELRRTQDAGVLEHQYGGAGGAKLFELDAATARAPVIHLKMENPKYRMFGHFLQFVALGSATAAARANALVRSALHFRPDMLEIAARLAAEVVIAAPGSGGGGGGAPYYALHVRRNDFQYHDMFVDAATIERNVRQLIPAGATVYIATDERRKSFFTGRAGEGPLARRYTLVFLDDVLRRAALPAALTPPKHWLGAVEQLICTQAALFAGTRLSTFTAYIQRMRGYMARGDYTEPGGSKRLAAVNTGLYYVQGTQRQRPYERLVADGDPKGETAQRLQEAIARGAPVWGRAFSQAWRDLPRPPAPQGPAD